ncbi:DeoR family transcriptional regulator [Clostridioides difficile]
MFDISIETARRDLAHMESIGLLKRVYGGALKI